MDATWYDTWLNSSSLLVVGGVLLVLMIVAAMGGAALQAGLDRLAESRPSETREGYIVSAVAGLYARVAAFHAGFAEEACRPAAGGLRHLAHSVDTVRPGT